MAWMARKPYPSDVTDEEWDFVLPYLTLMRPDAPQREHDLREVFNGMRYGVRAGEAWRMMPTRPCRTTSEDVLPALHGLAHLRRRNTPKITSWSSCSSKSPNKSALGEYTNQALRASPCLTQWSARLDATPAVQ
jgi:transposase